MSGEEAKPTPAPVPDDERLYGIAQVSRLTGLKPFVLRYWESEFPMLEPVKGKTGHRLYREQDIDLVKKIKTLLYEEGFTIAGARRHLADLATARNGNGSAPHEETSSRHSVAARQSPDAGPAAHNGTAQLDRAALIELRDALRSFLTLLERK